MQSMRLVLFSLLAVALTACDKFMPDKSAEIAANGKATGAACRHAGRAIEDCFTLNPDALRGAVFDGWKEMNDYMRENKIEEVAPKQAANAAPEAGEQVPQGEVRKSEEDASQKIEKAALRDVKSEH